MKLGKRIPQRITPVDTIRMTSADYDGAQRKVPEDSGERVVPNCACARRQTKGHSDIRIYLSVVSCSQAHINVYKTNRKKGSMKTAGNKWGVS
ncbi:hypothetical protein DPEC_G00257690 [Dallia pectoralis]|uniref:Uncharacterized protein n=1 Tax=Dallia pectoralis TaxID=75939 RepID=A0ACC2FQM1_DALPE|nr:hypothetical protein DPEC_G00257690 [Dallia pectoralis]